ncbi:MAG: dephospho-CoA kinase [Candidatus Marinimicrobia bacterium]|nr:dephospho-CoA kinase [Candidatus Neomarinimicrobiota bacterium]|tara:strand:+ start:776 stop:1372 length:597 start_codon:yes stop_codon:yes gene_type:complete
MLKIGITGGIGSGKSTASNRMGDLGAYVFDADKESKNILLENKRVYHQLIDQFSSDIINTDDTINQKKLANIAFANKNNQMALNSIVHPYVFHLINKRYDKMKNKKNISIFVIDAALIFETGLNKQLDYVVLVSAKFDLRMSRTIKRRSLSYEEIKRRMDLQLSEKPKIKMADFVINNNHGEKELIKQVDEIYKAIIL